MIAYTTRNIANYGQNEKTESNSCLSKIKNFIKAHPYIFFGIIGGIIIIVVVVVVLCVTLTKKDKEIQEEEEDEGEEFEDSPIFPLEDSLKSKVVEIYNDIDTGAKDQGTLEQFLQYISEKSSNLNDAQKVYLAHYWITRKIKYDNTGLNAGVYSVEPANFFSYKRTVCSGYARLFKQLLLTMNYNSSKIKNIHGHGKGAGYSEFNHAMENHEWNAVEINGKWCLIDTTWDASSYLLDEFYLCTPPKCFIRDHFPTDDQSLQFLKNPITIETYEGMVKTQKGFCRRNIEIIEDKAVQNICGRGSVIVKYKIDEDDTAIGLDIMESIQTAKTPQYFITRIEGGYKVDLSINEIGRHGLYFSIKYSSGNTGIGNMYFECDEEPEEKIFYPKLHYMYQNSISQLISPIKRDLIIGQRYTFEVRTSDYPKLIIEMENEKISMTKNGDTFKEENVFVHGSTIYITAVSTEFGGLSYISFKGIGENVGYPECIDDRSVAIDYRLLNPLIPTLTKGVEYKFEIRCYSEEIFRIKYGTTYLDMENINNVYTKTITIDRTKTDSELYIVHYQTYDEVAYNPRNLFKYNLS